MESKKTENSKNSILISFRLLGVEPKISDKKILVNPNEKIELIQKLVTRTYHLNARFPLIFNNIVLSLEKRLKDYSIDPDKDIIFIRPPIGGSENED